MQGRVVESRSVPDPQNRAESLEGLQFRDRNIATLGRAMTHENLPRDPYLSLSTVRHNLKPH